MNIGPTPEILKALKQNGGMPWLVVLGELIHNSFDAGAKQVVVTVGPGKRIVVADDGNGCN